MSDNTFTPTIAQAMYGQPYQTFEVPVIMEAVLAHIDYILGTYIWNKTQETYVSPFGNNGESFKCDTFEVESYSWSEDGEQKYNFAWKDLRISWYKRAGRGMSSNVAITPDMANECLIDCLKTIDKLEDEAERELMQAENSDLESCKD